MSKYSLDQPKNLEGKRKGFGPTLADYATSGVPTVRWALNYAPAAKTSQQGLCPSTTGKGPGKWLPCCSQC